MFTEAIVGSSKNPNKLFLIDGIGASLSAFLLGIVLVKLESVFGIPRQALYLLALFPVFFAIYDFYYHRKRHFRPSGPLKGIAIMNLLYCLLSIGIAFFYCQVTTHWGWAYVMTEVIIVVGLATLELRVAQKLNEM